MFYYLELKWYIKFCLKETPHNTNISCIDLSISMCLAVYLYANIVCMLLIRGGGGGGHFSFAFLLRILDDYKFHKKHTYYTNGKHLLWLICFIMKVPYYKHSVLPIFRYKIPDSSLFRVFLGVYTDLHAWTTKWQVEHQHCSRSGRIRKNHNILRK